MAQYSSGGSRIFDHSEKEANVSFEVAEAENGWREALEAHLEKHLGPCDGVFHEMISTTVHLDLYCWHASENREYHTIVTVGVSDADQHVPEGAEMWKRIELMMHLPASWPLPNGSEMDECDYWPFRLLKQMGRLPHELETFLAEGHTVPNGNPAEPYAGSKNQECALMMPPVAMPEDFGSTELMGRPFKILQIMPITERETEIKLKYGMSTLMECMQEQSLLNPVLNINRACASQGFIPPSNPELEGVYAAAIRKSKRKFLKQRSGMGFFAKRRFKPRAPRWAKSDKDGLLLIYKDNAILREQGTPVWGHIVQANQLLFDPEDTNDCPAAAIYSLDPYYDGKLEELQQIAHSLFDIKGEDCDEELRLFSKVLADERTTLMKQPLPLSLTGGREVFYTSIMVHRKQLPFPFLAASAFPLLVAPKKTVATMILPHEYWSEDMIDYWVFCLREQLGIEDEEG